MIPGFTDLRRHVVDYPVAIKHMHNLKGNFRLRKPKRDLSTLITIPRTHSSNQTPIPTKDPPQGGLYLSLFLPLPLDVIPGTGGAVGTSLIACSWTIN